jgi:predicted nucleotidyltransferase
MEQVIEGAVCLARRIAPVRAATPCVAAVMVGGSIARGPADRNSDLELGIFIGTQSSVAAVAAEVAP